MSISSKVSEVTNEGNDVIVGVSNGVGTYWSKGTFEKCSVALATHDSSTLNEASLTLNDGDITISNYKNGSYNSYNLFTVAANATPVSGTNDGTNWTSLTIGSSTYTIPAGGGGGSSITLVGTTGSESISDGTTTLNVVTRDTAQTISGLKTITNSNLIFDNGWGTCCLQNYGNSRLLLSAGSTGQTTFSDGVMINMNSRGIHYTRGNYFDLGTTNNYWRNLYTSGGTIMMKNLPTSDPQVEGQLWNDNGVLKISAGV